MKTITAALYAWGKWKVRELTHNPYSDTNILHRYMKNTSVQTMPPRDRILCFDPKDAPQIIIDINREWNKLPRRQKQCVFGKYAMAHLLNEQDQPFTAKMAANRIKVSHDTFDRNASRGRQRIASRVNL